MPDGHHHVFSLRFFYALFILITILFSTACDKKNIPPDIFIGKTKQEVLEIIFKESPRLNDGSLNIMTVTSQRKYNNYYYKTMNDAVKDEKLMTAEIWQIDFRKEFAISIFQHVKAIELYFKDGKVIRYEISNWRKT